MDVERFNDIVVDLTITAKACKHSMDYFENGRYVDRLEKDISRLIVFEMDYHEEIKARIKRRLMDRIDFTPEEISFINDEWM